MNEMTETSVDWGERIGSTLNSPLYTDEKAAMVQGVVADAERMTFEELKAQADMGKALP